MVIVKNENRNFRYNHLCANDFRLKKSPDTLAHKTVLCAIDFLFWKTCLRIRRQSENVSQDSKHTIKPMEKSTIFEMRSPSNPKTHNEDQQPKFQEFWFQHKQHNTFRSKCVCENGSANLCKVPFRFGGVAGELDWPIHHKMRFTYAPLMRHLCAARTRFLGLISAIAPPALGRWRWRWTVPTSIY